jgi:ABC-type branched-subunit amino acid transport system substrate-binding protein
MVKFGQVKHVFANRARSVAQSVAIGAALLLAGCASVVPKGPQTVAPPQAVEPAHPTPTGSSQLPQDIGRHRVALLVPMTGRNAIVGQAIANAANMAVLDTGGQTIRVTIYDTAPSAASAAQKALAEGNQLILGPLLSEDARAIAPIARAAHVPVVSFSNDRSVGGDGVWVMGFTPSQAISRVVSYAHERGANNFAGLAPVGVYGQRASTALLRATQEVGGQVVAMESYDHSRQSMQAAVTKLKLSAAYDAVLIADQGKDAVVLAPLIRRTGGAKAQVLGTELWNVANDLHAVPELQGAWFASVSDGLFEQLAAKYRARFGKTPPRLASFGYDSVLLAMKIASEWKNGGAFPVNKLTDKGGFSGIDGVFRFTKDGIAERGLQVNQIMASGLKVVSPAPQSLGN